MSFSRSLLKHAEFLEPVPIAAEAHHPAFVVHAFIVAALPYLVREGLRQRRKVLPLNHGFTPGFIHLLGENGFLPPW